VLTLRRPRVGVDPHERPEIKKSSACPANGKRFMRWRGSHYRETADRRIRFIAPIRAAREQGTSPRLERDRDEWTEMLQLPADTQPSNQTAHPWHYRGNA
jgi:hypothetical protein